MNGFSTVARWCAGVILQRTRGDVADRFRLGEFEFDVSSGELHRPEEGGSERLPPQPARLLQMLAEHGGAIVTRAAIRERLWPETHVDFDTSLYFCVRQLRVALGDSGSEPRYVQNVPRRGYRLIPEVTRVGNDDVTAADILRSATKQERDVLQLLFVSELSYSDAALSLDIPVGTVKSIAHRGLKRLRREARAMAA